MQECQSNKIMFGMGKSYGGNLLPPSGRAGSAAVLDSDLTDTDVPDDEDFLLDWDEKSEMEKGFGPKATWTQDKDKGYNFHGHSTLVTQLNIAVTWGVVIHSHVCLVSTNMNIIVKRSVVTAMVVSIPTSYSTPQSLDLLVEKK